MFNIIEDSDGTFSITIRLGDNSEFIIAYSFASYAAAQDHLISRLTELLDDQIFENKE